MGGSEFDAATALDGDGPVFGAALDGQWDGKQGPNGGFLLALATRAMGRVLPFPHPLVVSGLYLRPGSPGPAQVRTEVIRSGRTTGFAQASLVRDGKEVLRADAAFTDLDAAAARGLPSFSAGGPPVQPSPEQCAALHRDLTGPGTLGDRIEIRAAEPPFWATGGQPSGRPVYTGWMRFADGREPDLLSLALFVDAARPAALEAGLTAMTTVQLTVHLRARPAPGWLAYRAETRNVSDGYFEEDAELWDSAGRLVAQSRQLALALA
jgi:acyl-CoA thioesterase